MSDDVLLSALNAHVARSITSRREEARRIAAQERAVFRQAAQAVPIFRHDVLDHIIPGRFEHRVRCGLARC